MKTILTDEQKIKAINKIINDNNSRHVQIIYSQYININTNKNNCLYCNEISPIYSIHIYNSEIGNFCSKLCKNIYISLIRYMSNDIENLYLYFPYKLLTNESKKIYNNIKKNFNYIISYNLYENIIYIYLKKDIGSSIEEVKLTFISYNNYCLYCNSTIKKTYINLNKFNLCSSLCKYSFNKEIIPLFNLEFHYNFYLPPINMISTNDYNEIKFLLSNYDNQYLFGGFKNIFNNKLYIEIFLSK
jgi:hypothetical protein